MVEQSKPNVRLRPVVDEDLPVFYDQECDPEGAWMAAFTPKNPADRSAFEAHWVKFRGDPTIRVRTVLADDTVVGNVMSYIQDGDLEVTYWIGRKYWGRGIATEALRMFVDELGRGRLRARAAKDNIASIRVLEKCGFKIAGADRGFANARNAEIDELILERTAWAE